MEFLQRPQRTSPLHGPEEVEQLEAVAGEKAVDARIKHLARVPLFSGCTDEELDRIAHISKIVESPAGTV